ncbi:MAG: hypothetical protein M3430_04330 [Acidobacteriota bacterium]|nr:hypothetical protein [Acidobacteriota bacterium]
MNEQHGEIPARVTSPQSHVHILTRAISFFHKPELRLISHYLFDFVCFDAMLEGKLINNTSEPDDAFDVHSASLKSATIRFVI